MNWYAKLLASWDKTTHFTHGATLSVLVVATCGAMHLPMSATFAIAVIIAWCLGQLKETLDDKSNDAAIAAGNPPAHEVSGWDTFATTLGGVYVGGVFWLAR